MEAARARGIHPAAAAALRETAQLLPPSPARARAVEALDDPQLSCVVTGQQVGLFVGPLYSLWKAATAIAWARRLEAETGGPVVPVFWLQTEDHDLDEIAGCTVTDRVGGVHETRVGSDGLDRSSIAHRHLRDDVRDAIDRVAALLGGLPHADAAVDALRRLWVPGVSWADAFTRSIGEIFAETPLLVLQPRTSEIAAATVDVHRWALDQHPAISDALVTREGELAGAGFRSQVPVRADCSLSFFHIDGAKGPRHRLRRTGDGWIVADGSHTSVGDAVRAALSGDPMRFSSSALLRPLVQDALLPTAAYVGGPGEVSYWAQLPPLYALRGLPLPLVVPRASGTVVDATVQADLRRLRLRPEDIDDPESVLQRLGPPEGAPDYSGVADRVRAAVESALAEARASATALEPQLSSAFDKTVANAERAGEKLQRKLDRAALLVDGDRIDAVRRVCGCVRPNGTPQDRSSCWPDIAARGGVDELGTRVVDAVAAAVADPDAIQSIRIDI